MDPNEITTGAEGTGFVHPMLYMTLLVILPLVMQGLKKIVWIEQNKVWFCPLLCITAATGVAYYMQLPQWLLVGILTGAACNKVYDWAKDTKKAMLVILMFFVLVGLIGCASEISAQKRQCLIAQNTFTSVIEGLTLCKDKFSQEQIDQIDIAINQGADYLTEWKDSFKDPNIPVKDWLVLTNDVLINLLEYQKKGGDL